MGNKPAKRCRQCGTATKDKKRTVCRHCKARDDWVLPIKSSDKDLPIKKAESTLKLGESTEMGSKSDVRESSDADVLGLFPGARPRTRGRAFFLSNV